MAGLQAMPAVAFTPADLKRFGDKWTEKGGALSRSRPESSLEALMPKARRRPQLANATPTHVVHELLALAVAEPTLGCRQLADRLGDRGYVVSKTTVQKLLVDHGMGRRCQRVARAGPWPPWWADW